MVFPKTLISFLLLVLLSNTFSKAAEFVITAKINWLSADVYNKKPQKIQFYIGDSVVIHYDNKTDSLLEVTKAQYKACCTSDPIKSYHDGETLITFTKKGHYYYISGVADHCKRGEKVQIKVMEGKHHPLPPPAPAPSPPVTPPPAPVPIPSPVTPPTPAPIPSPATPPSAPVPGPEPETPVPAPAPGPEPETPVPAPAPGPEPETPVPAPSPGPEPEVPVPAPAPAPCTCEAPVPTEKLPRKNGNSGQNAGFWHYFF